MAVSALTIINGSGNVGTDYQIVADDVGAGKVQLVKLDLGAAGSSSLASGSVPVSASSLPLPSGAATEATLESIDTTLQGTLAVSAASLPLPSGAATAANQLPDNHQVTVSNASIAVTAASLPLPSGAATESTLQAVLDAQVESVYTIRYDEGATYTYIGEAAAGSATSSNVWRIKRLTNADNTILFADGDTIFNNIWDNRASLSYS